MNRIKVSGWVVVSLLLIVGLARVRAQAGAVHARGPFRYVSTSYPHTLNSNSVSVILEPLGETPESVAVSVQRPVPFEQMRKIQERAMQAFREEIKTNRNARLRLPESFPGQKDPKWVPFQTNLLVDLGAGEGEREILFAYKYKGQPFDGHWSGSFINVQGGAPTLQIVNPTNFLWSQPMIQLQGLTSRKFESLHVDQFDNAGNKVARHELGLGSSFPGGYAFHDAEGYFTFFDIDLSPGTNTFAFHGEDEFGNEMATNIVIVFSTAHDHTAPAIRLDWPKPGAEISGGTAYTMRGQMDDATAKLTALVETLNGSTTREALVERNGYFWIEQLPLTPGVQRITLTAEDAAGNTSRTNFSVIGCVGPIITMNPVNPPDLWKQFIDVTGRIAPAACEVWINGVQANVKGDGTWLAKNVPVLSPNGGTAVFEMSYVPRGGTAGTKAKTGGAVAAQASLGTNAFILNASSPACGILQLHLGETEGRSFVVLASTNLIDWEPLLTNINSAASFDYTFATTNYACRFFKVIPLP